MIGTVKKGEYTFKCSPAEVVVLTGFINKLHFTPCGRITCKPCAILSQIFQTLNEAADDAVENHEDKIDEALE